MSSGGQFIFGAFPVIVIELVTTMERDYSMQDTQEAWKRMGSFKAPVQDAYQVVFLIRTWHLILGVIHSIV